MRGKPCPIILILPFSILVYSCKSSVITEGISEEFVCNNLVESKQSAAECFNNFFKQKLEKIKTQREDVPYDITEMYSEVTEDDIFIHQDQYHINRSGYGSPYFIDNGRILAEHG
ncbi:MAG: hypothetical protein ACOCP4_03440 [Candidatus Woesearchaeota archaeon]